MPFSFHTHSGSFCHHARGTLSEVVETARNKGFVALGLSEHSPRWRKEDLYPEEIAAGIGPQQLVQIFDDYVSEARSWQRSSDRDRANERDTHTPTGSGRKSETSMEILVGMESERTTAETVSQCHQLIEKYSLDYVVGSVHHVEGIAIDGPDALYKAAEERVGGTEAVFQTYFQHQHEVICGLQPLVIGHFDLVQVGRPNHPLSSAVREMAWSNIAEAVSYGALFEINTRSYKRSGPDTQPMADFIPMMKKQGARFTLCDDSHGPRDIAMAYETARDFLVAQDITTLHRLSRQDGQTIVVEVPQWQSLPYWSREPIV